MDLVNLAQVTFKYDSDGDPILQDQTLAFSAGTFNLLTGPSGTGKSTLLKLIAGLYPAFTGELDSGTITINNQSVADLVPSERAKMVAMMFQNPSEQFAMDTPRAELAFTLENLQVDPAEIPTRIKTALAFADVNSFADRKFTTLSGGEQQKVSLAIIVALNASVILLDEPFANIDPDARLFLSQRLTHLVSEEHKTIIVADHDLSGYQSLIDALYVLDPTVHQVHRATSDEADQRFMAFDQQQHTTTLMKTPASDDSAEFVLTNFSIAHQEPLIDQVTLPLLSQRLTVITGANGTGKSTLFNALVKLQRYAGSATWHDHEVHRLHRAYAKQVALIFQQATSQFLTITVSEELALSQKQQVDSYWTADRIHDAMIALNLNGHEQQVVYSLSEGQKKKLQVLIMLIMGTPTLLLDEPLTGLDLASEHVVLQLLQDAVHKQGRTIIMISHQLTDVADYADLHLHLTNHKLIYEEEL